MKALFYSTVLLFTLTVSSCKKTDTAFSGAKVLTNTNFVAGYIDTYTYNADGTVSLIQRNTGERTVFIYSGDSVSMQTINAASVLESVTNYFLHGQTYADSSHGELLAQNNSAKYAFDGNSQLTQQKNYAFGSLVSVDDFTLTNKNTASVTYTNPVANTHSYSYYRYDVTKTNSIGNQNFGKGFLGVGSLNVATACVQIAQNGDTTGMITYKYRYDGNSNIDTLVTYNRNGQLLDSMAYTYK